MNEYYELRRREFGTWELIRTEKRLDWLMSMAQKMVNAGVKRNDLAIFKVTSEEVKFKLKRN